MNLVEKRNFADNLGYFYYPSKVDSNDQVIEGNQIYYKTYKNRVEANNIISGYWYITPATVINRYGIKTDFIESNKRYDPSGNLLCTLEGIPYYANYEYNDGSFGGYDIYDSYGNDYTFFED